jgi:UDPglucose--hexose-1-phosphate uridylyltransferase
MADHMRAPSGREAEQGAIPSPEIRLDQLTGLRTILSAARADRPFDFRAAPEESGDEAREKCPFDEGREDRTPPETWADRPAGGEPDTPGWRVRAVPNLYPALSQTWEDDSPDAPEGGSEAGGGFAAAGDPLRAASRGREPDLFRASVATGFHEVIVNSPVHHTSLGQLDDSELAAAVAGWRERMRAHAERAAYVQLIVNEGREAGASLEHTHAQLYALGFVPAAVARERERFSAYNQQTMGGDLLAEIASEEVRRRERLVAIDDDALLICPWASRSPFELRIIPRATAPSFELDGEAGLGMLRAALRALEARFGSVPQFNAWTLTAPRDADSFHWHLDIAPRIGIRAGLEMSTGVELNAFPPERAAAELREALG